MINIITAGLDKATLKTGDMDVITAKLAATFGGQAQTAANSYEGQLNRLTVGFDELKESFGKGFLDALGKTNDKTDGLMQSMKDLEPFMQKLGDAAYDTAEGFAQAAIDATAILDAINEGDWGRAWQVFAWGEDSLDDYTEAARRAKLATTQLRDSMGAGGGGGGGGGGSFGSGEKLDPTFTEDSSKAWAIYNETKRDAITAARLNAQAIDDENTNLNLLGSNTSKAATATDLLTTAFELQSKVVEDGSTKLGTQVSKLEAANKAVSDYASTLAGQLLGGIDLTAAQDTGSELGIGTMAAFDAQIAQADWFGNVLEEVKRQGGSQALIDYMAQAGPGAGGKFGQEAIDNGLVPTFTSKLQTVIDSANTLAQAMVPEGLRAGVDMAEAGIAGMATTFGDNVDKLAKIGKRLGKTIGDNSKAEILKAVAEALTEAETSRSAAGARRQASEAAANLLSDQQVAQAFARIIQTSNSRGGYSNGTTQFSPVLG